MSNKNMIKNNDNEDDDSTGGQGSGIQFHDFIGSGKPQRDDLAPSDIKQLLVQHDGTHRNHVERQREKQKNREALKNGNMSLNEFRHGKGQSSQYQMHPILQDKLRGMIDNQETPDPNANEAKVNEELRLENKLQNKPAPAPGMAPSNTPRNVRH